MQRPIPYTIDAATRTPIQRGFMVLGIFVCYEDICRDVVLALDENATDDENAFAVFLLDDLGNVIQGWFNLSQSRANYRFNLQARTV